MSILGAAASVSSFKPRRAKAAGTVTVWWTQGFYKAENQAITDTMADWEKKTGNKVNMTIMNGADLITKMIAAMQVGDVPDLVHSVTGDRYMVPRAAWNDQLEDLSDVMAGLRKDFSEAAVNGASYYNNKLKKHSFYSIPAKCTTMMHSVWRPLVQEAGYSDNDIPKKRDAYYDFFQTVQDKLRSKGKRIYGLGYSMATKEADANTLFHQFLINHGGVGIVTPDGKLNIDSPAIRKAATAALERLTTPFQKGYVPAGAVNWLDVDNNNAFFARQIVMTPNATISIPVAQKDKQEQYLKEIVTQGQTLDEAGKPISSLLFVTPNLIPKGAKNIDLAKDLLRYVSAPDNMNTYLKETHARYLPVIPSIIKNDPWWTDKADPHRPVAVDMALNKPTVPWWMSYHPGYSGVLSEQIWPQAEANVTQRGMTPEQSVEDAAKRIKEIFGRFQM